MNSRRLKILLGCYACDPNYGSEPGTGWQFVKHIARSHDIHVIVEKDEFEKHLTQYSRLHPDEVKNITFHFIRRQHHNLLRKLWPPSYYWFYNMWHKRAYKYAQQLHAQEHFDLVHQINMVGYRSPGELWKLNIPFIWGPIGGLNNTAWGLLPCMGWYGTIFYAMRNIFNAIQKRWSKAARIVSQKAHTIFVTDPESCGLIKKLWKRDALVMREVGTTNSISQDNISSHTPGTPLKICWAGVHEPRKGLNLLLDAISLCKEPVHLYVLGNGPCTEKWKQLTQKKQIESKVTFCGKIPHDDVFNVMSQSHVFCITSLSEGGTPNIVMEALQQGLPIVALNHCAYASVIDETCSIKVPISPSKCISQRFAQALDKIATSEDERKRLATGACARSIFFTWEAKMQQLNSAYESAASSISH